MIYINYFLSNVIVRRRPSSVVQCPSLSSNCEAKPHTHFDERKNLRTLIRTKLCFVVDFDWSAEDFLITKSFQLKLQLGRTEDVRRRWDGRRDGRRDGRWDGRRDGPTDRGRTTTTGRTTGRTYVRTDRGLRP